MCLRRTNIERVKEADAANGSESLFTTECHGQRTLQTFQQRESTEDAYQQAFFEEGPICLFKMEIDGFRHFSTSFFREANSEFQDFRGSNSVKIEQHFCTVECFARCCFVVKTSADKMILPIFDIFSHEFSLFFKPIEFLGLIKVNQQNLGKHSTVLWN